MFKVKINLYMKGVGKFPEITSRMSFLRYSTGESVMIVESFWYSPYVEILFCRCTILSRWSFRLCWYGRFGHLWDKTTTTSKRYVLWTQFSIFFILNKYNCMMTIIVIQNFPPEQIFDYGLEFFKTWTLYTIVLISSWKTESLIENLKWWIVSNYDVCHHVFQNGKYWKLSSRYRFEGENPVKIIDFS